MNEDFIKLGEFYFYNPPIADDSMKEIMWDVNLKLSRDDCWEKETEEIMKKEIKPGMTVADIGASIGYFTMTMAKLVGEHGTVYSIEPTPNQFIYLKHNVIKNGFENIVRGLNIAASDTDAPIPINCNACSPNKLLGWKMDDIFNTKIDFIKMDIDGSETRALKGLIKTIENNPNLKMIIEYHPESHKRLENKPEEMLEIIDKYFTYTHLDEYNLFCIKKLRAEKEKTEDINSTV